MINNIEFVELTPAQKEFCDQNINNFNVETWDITVAGKAGSDRSFLRISPPKEISAPQSILVIWDSSDNDWERFMGINAEFNGKLDLFPEIYAYDDSCGLILEEDCGNQNLKQYCSLGHDRSDLENIYKGVLDLLIKWQSVDTKGMPHITGRLMDMEMYLWETDYFADHCVTEYFGLGKLLDDSWEEERQILARVNSDLPLVPLHRDFQSENIMITSRNIKFVDYQGARLGSAEYDVASLLCDPYMSVISNGLRSDLLNYYIKESGSSVTRKTFNLAAMQRLMQALGAYANLSLHKGKAVYKDYISPALLILQNVLDEVEDYGRIKDIVNLCLKK